jgi:pyridoxal phosphate enzyme (YggS family)
MGFPGLADRLGQVRTAIQERQRAAGLSQMVSIVAVTKGHGADAVRAAAAVGLEAVGENRVQEALAKQDQTKGVAVRWHLIGTLQRNKARHAVGRFELIHSVDRLDLAEELNRRTDPASRQQILVQVNCSSEPQKGGVEPGALPPLLDAIAGLPRLAVGGLMTMAALTGDIGEQRRAFALLRSLGERAVSRGHAGPELSMGMSGDYLVAVEEGATMVRLGTLLFGERTP